MKKIFLLSFVLFIVGCRNSSSPEKELKILIDHYQNYGKDNSAEFPLGDYSESRFEKYAVFCDSLKAKLKTIESKKINEDNQISYELQS